MIDKIIKEYLYGKYILQGKIPKPVTDWLEWSKWYSNINNRIVKKTDLPNDVRVSTVFLGMDHSFGYFMNNESNNHTPILFETMIIGGEHDGYCDRYATWEQAEQGHEEAINLIFEV